MSSSFRIRNLIQKTWYATYANPDLLTLGLLSALLTIAINSFLFPYVDRSQNESIKDLLQTLPHSLLLLIVTTFFCKTLLSSQIFILSASDFFRRSKLLTPRFRLSGALTYTTIETISAIPVILLSYFLFITLLSRSELAGTISPFIVNASLTLLFIVILSITILKHLVLGYRILSPLRLNSSLSLSGRLFIRYRHFSILSFFSVLFLSSLFTIFENLVILQYAFIGRYLQEIVPETFIFTVLLLANTFITIFLEVFWLNFFLIITNKDRGTEEPIPLLRKKLEEIPSTPSL